MQSTIFAAALAAAIVTVASAPVADACSAIPSCHGQICTGATAIVAGTIAAPSTPMANMESVLVDIESVYGDAQGITTGQHTLSSDFAFRDNEVGMRYVLFLSPDDAGELRIGQTLDPASYDLDGCFDGETTVDLIATTALAADCEAILAPNEPGPGTCSSDGCNAGGDAGLGIMFASGLVVRRRRRRPATASR